MADLSTTFAGVKMRSPLGVAAMISPTGTGRNPKVYADFTLRFVERGAGYVYTAGTSIERQNPVEKLKASQRIMVERIPGMAQKLGSFALADSYVFLSRMDSTLEVIRILKEQLPPDVPIIGDLVGPGDDAQGWAEGARTLEQAGVDMVELDAACPITVATIAPEHRGMGHVASSFDEFAQAHLGGLGLNPMLADTPKALGAVTEAVVKAVKVPVGVKLTPESGFPMNVVLMKVAANAGAKYIVSVNGALTIAPPDIYNQGKPLWKHMNMNPFCGAGGPWLRYHVLKNIAAGCHYVPEVDHAAVGGIVEPRQVVEYLMLGAKHVGLASAVYLTEGVKAISRFTNFLVRFMDQQGYEKVDDMVGIAQKYIGHVDEKTDWGGGRLVAKIDRQKCTECGLCLECFCFFVITPDKYGRPVIDEEKCGACQFCEVICPEGAISLGEADHPSGLYAEW